MEKGFNDQELADIMSEIESLEKEFTEEAPAQKVAPVEASEDHTSPAVLRELVKKPEHETVLKTNQHADRPKPMKMSEAQTAPASLSFQVSGQMAVNLRFEVNGQSVYLAVSDEGLAIEMESGAKFTLPLEKAASKKAA